MYQIGDKIVYPMYGAGVIESVEDRIVLGKKQQYYSIRITASDMTVMLPLLGCDKIGVRSVINKEEAMKILELFRTIPVTNDPNWNKRQRENMAKIKSGDISKVVEVVKDLMYRDKTKGLSMSERKMFNTAHQILVSELVLSDLADEEDILSILNETIDALIQ